MLDCWTLGITTTPVRGEATIWASLIVISGLTGPPSVIAFPPRLPRRVRSRSVSVAGMERTRLPPWAIQIRPSWTTATFGVPAPPLLNRPLSRVPGCTPQVSPLSVERRMTVIASSLALSLV